jgi:hypothetical protein
MIINKRILLFFAGLIALTVHAQDFNCADNVKALETKVKETSWDDAALLLTDLRKQCPKSDIKVYTYGEKILKYKIEAAQPEDQKGLVQDLVSLYTQQENNFANTGGAVKKALLLKKSGLAKDDEVYKMLDAAFTADKHSFTDYNAFSEYFNMYLARYEAKDKGITQEKFIQKFADLSTEAAYARNAIAKKKEALRIKEETTALTDEDKQFLADTKFSERALGNVSTNMFKQAAKHFDCEKLESFYSSNYEKNKEDVAWLQGMAKVLYDNKCYKSATLFNGGIALNKANPTSDSAMMLGYLSQKRNETKQALAYYEQAAALQNDPARKANTYVLIASSYRNVDMAEAKKYALKAAATDPKSGEAYLLLGNMYMSASGCNLTDFDKKALLWLAADMFKKAEIAEPKYKATVAALNKRNTAKLPTKADIKAAKKSAGDTITYGCWINETVTIPKVK